jgi:hypothetical protein
MSQTFPFHMTDDKWTALRFHPFHSFNSSTGQANDGVYSHHKDVAAKLQLPSEVEIIRSKEGQEPYQFKLYYHGCLDWLHQLVAHWNKSHWKYSIIPNSNKY